MRTRTRSRQRDHHVHSEPSTREEKNTGRCEGRESQEVVEQRNTMTEQAALSRFQGEGVMSLETYRRNGEPVRTPVWFFEENRILYVQTRMIAQARWKRISRNPKVRIAPSHFRGKPKAEYIDARAELETSPEIIEKYHSKIYKKTASKQL